MQKICTTYTQDKIVGWHITGPVKLQLLLYEECCIVFRFFNHLFSELIYEARKLKKIVHIYILEILSEKSSEKAFEIEPS